MEDGIGFFDSGAGGLTVLREFVERGCPYPLYYYGDNAHAPYGNRKGEEIYSLTLAACRELLARGVKAVVLSCNTATALCIDRLRRELPVPVVGVEPALKPACAAGKRVLLLCTAATAASERVKNLISRSRSEVLVQTPVLLASAVEEFLQTGKRVNLNEHLTYEKVDAVVLGCTHYAFFQEEIARFYRCAVFDGAQGVFERVETLFPFSPGKSKIIFIGRCAVRNQKAFDQLFFFRPPKIRAETTKNQGF